MMHRHDTYAESRPPFSFYDIDICTQYSGFIILVLCTRILMASWLPGHDTCHMASILIVSCMQLPALHLFSM